MFIVDRGMTTMRLVELSERRSHTAPPVVLYTITVATARGILAAAKERWEAAGELDEPSLSNETMTRRQGITILVDGMRTYTSGHALNSARALKVMREVGLDPGRIGQPVVNSDPRRGVSFAR